MPSLFLVDDDDAARIAAFAEAGRPRDRHVPCPGIVDVDDQVRLGGYPGAFRDLLGVRVEEFHPLQEGERFLLDNGTGGAEWTEHVHAVDSEVIGRYATGRLAGLPAVTRRDLPGGEGGTAVYVSAALDAAGVDALAARLVPTDADAAGTAWSGLPDGLECLVRENDADEFVFFINHTEHDRVVPVTGHELLVDQAADGRLLVPGGAVRVVQRPRD